MKYWVYVDRQVTGPYEAAQLGRLRGFSAASLVCAAVPRTPGSKPVWQKAATILEIADFLQSSSRNSPEADAERSIAQEIISSLVSSPEEVHHKDKPPAPEELSPQQAAALIKEVEVLVSVDKRPAESLKEKNYEKEKSNELESELETAPKFKRKRRLGPWLGIIGVGIVLGGLYFYGRPLLEPLVTEIKNLRAALPVAPAPPTQPAPQPPVPPVTVPQEPDPLAQALAWVKSYPLPGTSASLGEKLEARYFVPGEASPWIVEKTGEDQYRVSFLVKDNAIFIFVAWPKLGKLKPMTPEAKYLLTTKTHPLRHPRQQPNTHLPNSGVPPKPTFLPKNKQPIRQAPPVEIPKLDPQSSQSGNSDPNMNLDQLVGSEKSN